MSTRSPKPISLAVLTEQSRARRERRYETGITIEYEPGEHNGRSAGLAGVLQLPRPGEQLAEVEEAWIRKTGNRWLALLVGDDSFNAFMQTRPVAGHIDALWEMVGIEYEYASASGLVRMEEQYKRWREVRDQQREMLGETTSTPEPPSEDAPKG